jgi:hypothetical protein
MKKSQVDLPGFIIIHTKIVKKDILNVRPFRLKRYAFIQKWLNNIWTCLRGEVYELG